MQIARRMTLIENLRRGMAVVLMACFFLPLAECQKKEDAPVVESVGQMDEQPPGLLAQSRQTAAGFWDSPEKERFFPAELPVSEVGFWFWLGLLGGPLGCAILRRFVHKPLWAVLSPSLEIGPEAYLVWCFTGMGPVGWTICWGGRLALMVATLLALAAARDLFVQVCRWWAQRNLEDGLHRI